MTVRDDVFVKIRFLYFLLKSALNNRANASKKSDPWVFLRFIEVIFF